MEEALNKAILDSDSVDWEALIDNPMYDGFLNVLNNDNSVKILKGQGFQSIKDFFLDIERFENDYTDPQIDTDPSVEIYFRLWFNLKRDINKSLAAARNKMNIPERGGVLVYIAGLSLCLVIKFDRISQILKIVDVIENPKSVFDFWDSIERASMGSKNILKEIISTGHKLIYHRGILIHVDRRKDQQVFGPSIDTLIMNEIMVQIFLENNIYAPNCLEIGCGNGLLTVCLAKYLDSLTRMVTIDINFNSIYCTHKNLTSNLTDYQIKTKSISKINGRFDASLLRTQYDLIVCNPPYIPIPKSDKSLPSNDINYFTAVGGLELIDDILDNLDTILSKKGVLFLLISHLCKDHVEKRLKDSFQMSLILEEGIEVLFDVEAVFNNERWLKYLLEDVGLVERKKVYYHAVLPYVIKRKET